MSNETPLFNFLTDLKLDALEKAGVSDGFMGCLKDVELGRKAISIQSEFDPKILQRKNLIECNDNPCSRMPCSNNGSCEAFQQGYKCNCKPNYTGKFRILGSRACNMHENVFLLVCHVQFPAQGAVRILHRAGHCT